MNDGEGSKVTLSLNLNPNAGPGDDPWDMKHIHFSSNQPDPEKWGEHGWMRSTDGFDPGSSKNPGDEQDMSFFAELFSEAGAEVEESTIIEDLGE